VDEFLSDLNKGMQFARLYSFGQSALLRHGIFRVRFLVFHHKEGFNLLAASFMHGFFPVSALHIFLKGRLQLTTVIHHNEMLGIRIRFILHNYYCGKAASHHNGYK